jgi:subtilisin family serine protease
MPVGEESVAIFSNYGQSHVDLFAPGQHIVSLDTANRYSMNDGTSLSAPIVSGIAALLLSYHPELTAKDLVHILTETAFRMDKQKVLIPDLESPVRKKVKFRLLSKSGGVVNAYDAMRKADLVSPVRE